MKIIATTGNEDLAQVYLAELANGRQIEFVESKIPGQPREKKWVLILSTLAGCPSKCPMCDAGSLEYQGPLSSADIFAQIDYLVGLRYSPKNVPVEKFKIQFARVGEPSFNPAVLDVLEQLPSRYQAKSLIPAISTIAPAGQDKFFDQLLLIKERYFRGKFQLQFSIHSTCQATRNRLIPLPHWPLKKIAAFGNVFCRPSDKKITLNFAAIKNVPFDSAVIAQHFSPEKFLIKITPLNPTDRSTKQNLSNGLDPHHLECYEPAQALQKLGYDVILSIGELEENNIGSNCGQYILAHLKEKQPIKTAYTYELSKK
ncbi:MAG: radical SAM protein [Pseudomonadota bacterium]